MPAGRQQDDLPSRITRLREEREAVILAHNYQPPEIQDIADFVGDSLGLSREAADTGARVIVFCGVHFMAETAAILSPEKTVLLPELRAGCPMADMIDVEGLLSFKEEHPGLPVVCYVNSSAAVKAVSDVCCTSANAIDVVLAIDSDELIMVPDRNLAAYVEAKTGKAVFGYDGFCPTHERIKAARIEHLREEHPAAVFVAHPECQPEVLALADHVASTSQIFSYASHTGASEVIVGTEMGVGHKLRRDNPDKTFYFPGEDTICPNMKLMTLEKVAMSLEALAPVITVEEEARARALAAVERMVELG